MTRIVRSTGEEFGNIGLCQMGLNAIATSVLRLRLGGGLTTRLRRALEGNN